MTKTLTPALSRKREREQCTRLFTLSRKREREQCTRLFTLSRLRERAGVRAARPAVMEQ